MVSEVSDIYNIYSITGLFSELYNPSLDQYSVEPLNPDDTNPLWRINGLFWAQLFSSESIDLLLATMDKVDRNSFDYIEKAVIADPVLFKEITMNAPRKIVNQKITDREMYQCMESIEIACMLFSKYIYHPFSLSIQDGFQEPTLSISALCSCANDTAKNPYSAFLEKEVYPVIKRCTEPPKLVWINGQLRISSVAIGQYIKLMFPNATIGLRYHSSEYFSLNKIDDLLTHNHALFDIIDFIVLDDSQYTCSLIEKALCNGEGNLGSLKNILYKTKDGRIINTGYSKVWYTMAETARIRTRYADNTDNYLDPHSIMNLKYNPNTACYWNKCSFCAINKKYKFIHNTEKESIDEKISAIKHYREQGIRYFWFEDEALPAEILHDLASRIIEEKIAIKWQVRSRIDTHFTAELAQTLYRSGLREIRFGLESANLRILSLMNKFPDDITLKTVEDIVKSCTECGIHVHFPMIVGFPTETARERIETYRFLQKLRNTYGRVSFNINILMLDVASDLFRNYAKYNISSVSFPCKPYAFLGNMVNYYCEDMDESNASIDLKRNEFMRTMMYPWMPQASLIRPNIFYRLSETIRNTLIWHCRDEHPRLVEPIKGPLLIERYLSYWQEGQDYIIYNWKTHKIFRLPVDNFNRLETYEGQMISDAVDDFGQMLISAELLVVNQNGTV